MESQVAPPGTTLADRSIYARTRAAILTAWRTLRVTLTWRMSRPGWRERVRIVTHANDRNAVARFVYDDGVTMIGAPREWCLLPHQVPANAPARCADSGLQVDPAGPPLGVRCARCECVVAARFADMELSTDVPSCAPCRSAVRAQIRRARLGR